MPTYDYKCQECGYTFEHFQMMSDDPLTECPSCGGKVRRLIGGGLGIIFKGSGFYVTDNKSGGKKMVTTNDAGKNGGKETAVKESKTPETSPPAEKKKETPVEA